MADEPQISLLFATISEWAVAQGADKINRLPGPWTGETDEWTVKINGHPNEIDDVPPYGFLATHKTAFIGMAIGNAYGGCVIGPSENELIEHFRSRLPSSIHLPRSDT